jgi:hypothetical protein
MTHLHNSSFSSCYVYSRTSYTDDCNNNLLYNTFVIKEQNNTKQKLSEELVASSKSKSRYGRRKLDFFFYSHAVAIMSYLSLHIKYLVDLDRIENTASNNSYRDMCAFIAAGKFLRSRCLETAVSSGSTIRLVRWEQTDTQTSK